MTKKNYTLIGLIFVAALVLGFMVGWGIKRSSSNLTTTRVINVGDEIPPTPTSFSSNQPIRHAEMIKHFNGIIEKNPNNASAFAGLGDVYFDMKRFEDAIKNYKKAIELNPQDVDTYNDLGLSYHYIGSSEEGLNYIEDGIKAAPRYQRIWLTKGFILATTGEISEAIKAWDKTYTIEPNSDVAKAALDFLNQYRPISLMEEGKSSGQEE